jgi:hypothetical protein
MGHQVPLRVASPWCHEAPRLRSAETSSKDTVILPGSGRPKGAAAPDKTRVLGYLRVGLRPSDVAKPHDAQARRQVRR